MPSQKITQFSSGEKKKLFGRHDLKRMYSESYLKTLTLLSCSIPVVTKSYPSPRTNNLNN